MALLWQHLRNVFSKNEHSEDSLGFLLRFGSRFRIFTMTETLRAMHALHSSPAPEEKWFRRAAYTYGVHGPRNFEYGYPPDQNQRYLQRCSTVFPSSLAIRFFYALSQGVPGQDVVNCDSVPAIRRYFFGGLAATRRSRLADALNSITKFLALQEGDPNNPLSPFAIEEARRSLVDVHRLKGDVVEMQRVVVRTFLDRPQSVRRLAMHRVYEACLERKDEASKHIEFPIIAYIACDDPHEVWLALKRFMRNMGVMNPFDLTNVPGLDQRALAVLFLRVCTPEVVDSHNVLDLVEKVETERLGLLRWITENSPTLLRLAETEILRLTQHAQLRDALEKIEGTRVVVNVAALREAEQDRFSDAYFRFAAQRELATSQTQEEVMSAINVLSRSGGGLVVVQTDALLGHRAATFKAFASAFREIRDAFVSSPHFGIEASLSGRIRHGIVIQHIRKPFVERKLAVKKDSPERSEIQDFWRTRLWCNAQSDGVAWAMNILFKLTDQINSIAEEVKGVWLHSKTETRNPGGLFDYSFSDEQLQRILSTTMRDVAAVGGFLDRVFDVLLERTRAALRVVRDRIDYELSVRLRSEVDNAIGKLSECDSNINSNILRNDLVASRQDSERTCEQMKAWFQEADATLMGDASFELAAQTAVGMVEQLNPGFRRLHQIEVNCEHRIRGRHFTTVVHILFFMLENALRHSDVSRELFRSKLSINGETAVVSLRVENRMSSVEAAAAACKTIQAKIDELKAALDPEKVVREGGSGFAKIIAALLYEFKDKDPDVTAACDGVSLAVTVTCDITALAI